MLRGLLAQRHVESKISDQWLPGNDMQHNTDPKGLATEAAEHLKKNQLYFFFFKLLQLVHL